MGNPINIATTGLLAVQRALSTASHNITNASVDGYSRQSVEFSVANPQQLGGFSVGAGVTIKGINRASDIFANQQLQTSLSSFNEASTYFSNSTQLDSLFANPNTSFSNNIQSFFSSVQTAAENPGDLVVRENLFTQGNTLVSNYQTLFQQVTSTNQLINEQVKATVNEVNTLASNLALVNNQVAGQTNPSADLLDKRDQLVNELAQYVNVSTLEQSDGAVNINIGSGQPLVIGGSAIPLSTGPSKSDPSKIAINIAASSGSIDISKQINGGKLGGLVRVQTEILDTALNRLGQIAVGLADAFNNAHQLGMDINDNLGKNFFNDINTSGAQIDRVITNDNNTGNAVLQVNIDDTSQLQASDYEVTATTGPQYVLTRLSDNTTSTFNSFPHTVDGMTISVTSGSTTLGDSFIIAPTRFTAKNFQLNINNADELALASPIRTQTNSSNTGSGSISEGQIIDTSTTAFTTAAKQLSPPVRIEFLSATSYQLVNATTSGVIEGPIAFTPNSENNIFPTPGSYDPGYQVTLSGAPLTGDNFTVNYNNGGIADNRIANQLADLQNQSILEGSNSSFQDVYALLINEVGSRTHHADISAKAGQVLVEQATDRRDGIAGVNLDEEAASLLKLEQMYQAISQVISVSNRLINTLMDSMR